MAEGVDFLLEKLSKLITREANLLAGVEEQINSLCDELEMIRSSLKDADVWSEENDRVKVWVNQVRDIADKAQDVIDKFIHTVKRRQRRQRIFGVFGSLRGCLCKTYTLHYVGNEIEKIKKKFKEISANRVMYGIGTRELGESSSSMNPGYSWKPRTGPIVEEANIVGIKDDVEKLVGQLTEGEEQLFVLSIVGMPGLGKTTLANKVYNCNVVSKHFKDRAWIYLSREYGFREVLMGIIKQVVVLNKRKEVKLEKMDDEGVRKELSKYLKERRFLVVIDDIWSVDDWDRLKTIFPEEGTKGSRVILTTRNREVARHAKSISHELGFLKEEDCWVLFCQKALPRNVTTDLSTELEKIGRQIVAKCGGLPLAVDVLGGLLSSKEQIPSEWQNVLKGINWQLDEGQNQIYKILSPSFNDLPHFLKLCFLYSGVYPEDFEISADKLIHLWVSEGLVQQRGNGTMEQVAEHYLEELANRSLIQVLKRRSNGRIKTCRIHGCLRDLARLEAKNCMFLDFHQNAESASQATAARRLTIDSSIVEYMSQNRRNPNLRSLLRLGSKKCVEKLIKKDWKFFCKSFKMLRVLVLSGVAISKLPSEIFELIHLRHLGLRRSVLRKVPRTISNLVHLQTLDIKHGIEHRQSSSYYDQTLPSAMSTLDQLRHVNMSWGIISRRFKIEYLRNLQTLSGIVAGGWIKDGLARLPNIRKLGVTGVLNSHGKALSDAIDQLILLESLLIKSMGEDNTLPTFMLSEHVQLYKLQLFGQLEKLPELHEFPPNLTHLSLSHSDLMHDPMETLGRLPHLKILKLFWHAFKGKKMVCAAEGFPQLKEMELWDCYALEEWKIEEGAMSSLGNLKITWCLKLKMLPEGLQHVITLKELELSHVSRELKARILEENGEDRFKVCHVPALRIH